MKMKSNLRWYNIINAIRLLYVQSDDYVLLQRQYESAIIQLEQESSQVLKLKETIENYRLELASVRSANTKEVTELREELRISAEKIREREMQVLPTIVPLLDKYSNK